MFVLGRVDELHGDRDFGNLVDDVVVLEAWYWDWVLGAGMVWSCRGVHVEGMVGGVLWDGSMDWVSTVVSHDMSRSHEDSGVEGGDSILDFCLYFCRIYWGSPSFAFRSGGPLSLL